MKRKLAVGFLGLCLALSCAGWTWADDAIRHYPIMKPDRETRLRWIQSYETAPRAYIDASKDLSRMPEGSLSLLSHLNYVPSERNQGSCGDCWVWAGTGVMEIALDVQGGIFDRLSVQYVNSCFGTGGDYACCGGWLQDVSDFYTARGQAIPWSNENASFYDASRRCSHGSSAVPCGSIATSPSYEIDVIEAQSIPTHGVGQAAAIANIKNVLHQQRAVWFGFFMSTQADWYNFYSFWGSQSESVVWDFDPTCGKPWTSAGGGHAVLCVGYNDDDPANAYWIMLNSWGITAQRPSGIFRVAMDMNYDCNDGHYPNLYWQTLGVAFTPDVKTVYVEPTGACGGKTPCYAAIQAALNAATDGDTIQAAKTLPPEAPIWAKTGTVTISGGWKTDFSGQDGTTSMYAPKATGGGAVKIQPEVKIIPKP